MEVYKDTTASFEDRAKDLVKRMTLQEKVSQTVYMSNAIERLGIPQYSWWNECLHGVARAGIATVFPQSIGMAATFDTDLMLRAATVISDEARAKHHESIKYDDRGIYKGLTFWSPNVNIFRDPRWGRGHETYGEDPVLTGRLGAAFCKGLQGDDDKYLKLVATPKHYAVHSGPEAIRHEFDALASKKDMYETYLPAFKTCVDAGAYSIMGAYNRTNGEPCCGSKTLLQDILRDDWGFEGYVVSDCGAISDFHEHHKITDSPEESAAMAVKNGCDLNCGMIFESLNIAVEKGLISEEELDTACYRLMLTRLKLGMFDPEEDVPYSGIPFESICCDENLAAAKEMTDKSLVLLKNDGILPLNKDEAKRIAVIGPNANNHFALLGNYYGMPSFDYTVLDGIREVASGSKITYAMGSVLAGNSPEEAWGEVETWGFAEAVAVAKRSDVVVLVLGLDATLEGEESAICIEGGDKTTIDMPQIQQDLMKEVAKAGKPIIMVNITGSSMDLQLANEKCSAIMQGWYPGQYGGLSIAQAIFGDINPCGKLPVTFYRDMSQLPEFTDYNMAGRTYRYFKGEPAYPFGYGLSYTNYEYSDAKPENAEINAGQSVKLTVNVTNTGKRYGNEIVQLYLKDNAASTSTPIHTLVDFCNIHLHPGESKTVQLEVTPRAMALILDDGTPMVEEGEFTLYVGGIQPDDKSKKLTGSDVLTVKFNVTGSCAVEY